MPVAAGAVPRSGPSSGTGAGVAARGVAGRGAGSAVAAARPSVARSAADDEADAASMRAWVDGDASAFDALHACHGDALWRFARRGCADEAVAGELYQDVWLRAIEHRGAWRPETWPEASLAESEPAPGVSTAEALARAGPFDVPATAPAPRDGVASDGVSRARSNAFAARSLEGDAAAASARPPAAVRETGTPRDGARRVIERLREQGVDAALESHAAWRTSWPEADLAELVGGANDGELERLREATPRRGLPPPSPVP